MSDSKGYSLIGEVLTTLIDCMNKADVWKDHSAELAEIATAFRRIAEPLGPEGVERAFRTHIEMDDRDERATYEKIGTILVSNVQFILRHANLLENSRTVLQFASIFELIATPLGPAGVQKAIEAWHSKK